MVWSHYNFLMNIFRLDSKSRHCFRNPVRRKDQQEDQVFIINKSRFGLSLKACRIYGSSCMWCMWTF